LHPYPDGFIEYSFFSRLYSPWSASFTIFPTSSGSPFSSKEVFLSRTFSSSKHRCSSVALYGRIDSLLRRVPDFDLSVSKAPPPTPMIRGMPPDSTFPRFFFVQSQPNPSICVQPDTKMTRIELTTVLAFFSNLRTLVYPNSVFSLFFNRFLA